MTTRSCPDWPRLVELAPDLHFKHYTASEAQLPAEALAAIPDLAPDSAEVCADLAHNVFNPEHTDARIAEALRATHWFDLREWVRSGPGH